MENLLRSVKVKDKVGDVYDIPCWLVGALSKEGSKKRTIVICPVLGSDTIELLGELDEWVACFRNGGPVPEKGVVSEAAPSTVVELSLISHIRDVVKVVV